jgi:triose/dihydroxyacetone kinase / FAD-AMP lyase (cyclizing)
LVTPSETNSITTERDWNISLCRIYAGMFETSLNGPGFSLTLGNVTGMAKTMEVSEEEILELLDAPTTAPAWPKNGYAAVGESRETAAMREAAKAKAQNGAPADLGPAGKWLWRA